MATRRNKKQAQKRKPTTRKVAKKTATKTPSKRAQKKPQPAPARSNCAVLRIHGLDRLPSEHLAAVLAGLCRVAIEHRSGKSRPAVRGLFTPQTPCDEEGCTYLGPIPGPDGRVWHAYLCAGEFVIYPA